MLVIQVVVVLHQNLLPATGREMEVWYAAETARLKKAAEQMVKEGVSV